MNRTNKGLYAFLAFGPLALIVISVVGMFAWMASLSRYELRYGGGPPPMFFAFMGLIFLASIFSLVAMIMYIIHVTKNHHIPENNRIGWIIGMVLGGIIAQLIYFFMYISKEDQLEADRISRENYQANNNFGQGGQGRNPFD